MRRSDREVTGFSNLIKIMEECDVCRIALNNNGYPYILPLNFGMKVENDMVELFFHGANEEMLKRYSAALQIPLLCAQG